ncbi:MAG TPA: tetratricopeptide repeat protein [Candidatus Limnocylindrales bacterium]|nr:tetratricopeptide repeat protein [Candidatus Limnocylindrales bacterium]
MAANVEGMVREGVSAFKAGRTDEARALLSKAVELDPYNEQGWLWLSGVVSSVDDQRTCLENVLAINPGNARARSGLDFLIRQSAPPVEETPPPAPPPPAPVQPQPTVQMPESPPALVPPILTPSDSSPSSVEWGAYDSTPLDEANWHSPAPAPVGEYDDWVSGLQLGGAAETPENADNDPFARMTTSTSPFYDGSDLGSNASAGASFSAASSFMRPDDDEETPAPAVPVRPPLRPAPDDDEPSSAKPLGATYLGDLEIDDDEATIVAEHGNEFFPDIPREIRATRLPGTHERGPFMLKLAALLLVPLNLAAAVLLLWRLLSM